MSNNHTHRWYQVLALSHSPFESMQRFRFNFKVFGRKEKSVNKLQNKACIMRTAASVYIKSELIVNVVRHGDEKS